MVWRDERDRLGVGITQLARRQPVRVPDVGKDGGVLQAPLTRTGAEEPVLKLQPLKHRSTGLRRSGTAEPSAYVGTERL
jgi:hypothetical protein